MNQLMKAGEFARFCGTTKETLRHYDRVGVLRPAVRAENGYKFYAITQFTDLSLIGALQAAGLSLDGIRTYLSTPDRERLREVLHERIDALVQQRRELARKQRVLENTLACEARLQEWLDDAQAAGRYRWRIRECPEEYFIETPAAYDSQHAEDTLDSVADHLRYCKELGAGECYQESYRVCAEAVLSGDYAAGFCIDTRVDAPVDSLRLHVKPAGMYFQWLNSIDVSAIRKGEECDRDNSRAGEASGKAEDAAPRHESNPLFDAYDAMRAFAAEAGIGLVGDLYDSELSVCSGNCAETFYTEVSMRVDDNSPGDS